MSSCRQIAGRALFNVRFLMLPVVALFAAVQPAWAQTNSRDFRSITMPAEACEITTTEFTGTTSGGRQPNGAILICTELGGTGVVAARCAVPLSNVRFSGSGSPILAKFCVYYMDSDGAAASA